MDIIKIDRESFKTLHGMLVSEDKENHTVAFEILKSLNPDNNVIAILLLYRTSNLGVNFWSEFEWFSNFLNKQDFLYTNISFETILQHIRGFSRDVKHDLDLYMYAYVNYVILNGYDIFRGNVSEIEVNLKFKE